MHDLTARFAALCEWTTAVAGLALSTGQRRQLSSYLDALLLWNRKVALVSQRDPAQILIKHLADSLYAAARCADGEAVVDLGSGAGLPGLPIAIARPTSRVSLIESRGRKASFLEEARRATGARNAVVCHTRIEAAALDPEHRARYAVVTARALTSLSALLSLARPFLSPGGRVVAMRSTGERAEDSAGELETIAYELPDGTPRRLVVVRIPSP